MSDDAMYGAAAAVRAAESIRGRIGATTPVVGIILGSGLGGLADRISNPVRVPFADVPGFPAATVVLVSEGSSVKNVKVPLVPVISGVPMPARDSDSHSAGGKLAGIRTMFECTPCSASICQNARPARVRRMPPPASGIR